MWCEVKLSKYKKLLIGCIYRSESGSSDNNSKLNQLLQEACNKGYSYILILGDFNYKGITWENWNTPGLNDSNEEFLFVEALRDNYLNQHIMKPTRIQQGQEPSILDLVITGIGDLETPSNGLTGNDKDKTEILTNFFSSVFTQENMENMPTVTMSKSNGGLESYEIGVEDVRKKLSILNPNKSPGSDNLHPRILREMKNVLDKPLTMLYQETLTTGMIPDDWETCKSHSSIQKG